MNTNYRNNSVNTHLYVLTEYYLNNNYIGIAQYCIYYLHDWFNETKFSWYYYVMVRTLWIIIALLILYYHQNFQSCNVENKPRFLDITLLTWIVVIIITVLMKLVLISTVNPSVELN